MEEKDTSSIKTPEVSEKQLPKLLKRLQAHVTAKNLEEIKSVLHFRSLETRQDLIHNKVGVGQSLFFQACFAKATDIVKYFLTDCMANVNEIGEVGLEEKDLVIPLFIAIKWYCLDLVKLLVEYGADLNWKDPQGRNSIMYACYFHKMEAGQLLWRRGATINTVKNQDLCAQDIQYLRRALKLRLDMKFLDPQGNSYFMRAVRSGNLDIIALLLKSKVDFYQRNSTSGCNALDIALHADKKDVVNYLINNSVYTLADKVLSYELCGALDVLVGRNMESAAKYWDVSNKIRKKHSSTIEDSVKENLTLDNSSDIGSEEFHTGTARLAKWSLIALKVVCRIIGLKNPFTERAFTLFIYCPDLNSEDFLTFELVKEVSKFNSSSSSLTTNGAYIGMVAVVYMCEFQFQKCKRLPETIVPFIEKIVDIIADDIYPVVKTTQSSIYLFHIYKQMLLMLLHLIEHTLLAECPGKNRLTEIISKAAQIHAKNYPTSLLLIALERGFSFKTIVCLIAAGSNINVSDYHGNTPLHFLAEQPVHLPDRIRIQRYLVNNGCNMFLRNDYYVAPRMSSTSTT